MTKSPSIIMEITMEPHDFELTSHLSGNSLLAIEVAGLAEDFGKRFNEFPDKDSLYAKQLAMVAGCISTACGAVEESACTQSPDILTSLAIAINNWVISEPRTRQ